VEATGVSDAPAGITRPGLVGRLARCMTVSTITTVISFTILGVATSVFGVAPMLANVMATGIATIPSYSLNRRWTWGKQDRSDLWREIVPFWVLSFLGLALSTLTVGLVDSWASQIRLAPLFHTGALLAGHLSGFGLLWVVQFVLLDRVLFPPAPAAAAGSDVERAAVPYGGD
jgi:putative flippase GtrA